jgi:hypothetical protein
MTHHKHKQTTMTASDFFDNYNDILTRHVSPGVIEALKEYAARYPEIDFAYGDSLVWSWPSYSKYRSLVRRIRSVFYLDGEAYEIDIYPFWHEKSKRHTPVINEELLTNLRP